MNAKLLVCLLVVPLAGCADNGAPPVDDAPPTGNLDGQVLSEAGPAVRGARVSLLGASFFTDTDETGRFVLQDVPVGRYIVSVSATNFLPSQVEVDITQGNQTQDVVLMFDPQNPNNPHLHDLWRGQSTYVMFEGDVDVTRAGPEEPFSPAEDVVFGQVTGASNVVRQQFWIPIGERDDGRPASVLPGTREMHLTVSWDESELPYRHVTIRAVRDGERDTQPLANGETGVLSITPGLWDDGHRQFSKWLFYGLHDNSVDDPSTWSPGANLGQLNVRIELVKGDDLSLDEAHKDFWEGADSLVLRDWSDVSAGPIGVGREGRIFRLDSPTIVPPGTQRLDFELRWTTSDGGVNPMPDWNLQWRTAAMNPQTTTMANEAVGQPVSGSQAEGYKLYSIEIQGGENDGPYETSSGWQWRAWPNPVPEGAYWTNAGTVMDLRVTAYLREDLQQG